MIVSLDYDDTYTRDPEMWNSVALSMLSRGHEVYCITMRYEAEMQDVYDSIGRVIGRDKCVPTGRNAKQAFIADELGMHVDVWIDDNPAFILRSAEQ